MNYHHIRQAQYKKGFIAPIILIIIAILVLGGGAYVYVQNKQTNQPVSISPISGATPLTVNFSLSAEDSSDASGVYYTIVFGDDQAAGFPRISKPTLSHTYTSAGSYSVTITRRTKCSSWECLGPSAVVSATTVTVH